MAGLLRWLPEYLDINVFEEVHYYLLLQVYNEEGEDPNSGLVLS